MSEIVRYEVGSGFVLVEAHDGSYGVDHPLRNQQGILDAGRRLEEALAFIRPAAAAAFDAFDDHVAERIDIQFGIKLAGEAGAVIAKNHAESHLVVRMYRSGSGKGNLPEA